MRKKILNNFSSIFVGKIIELLINFLAITLIARHLGASKYGVFTSVVALVVMLSKLIDFGFAQIVFREVSSQKRNIHLLNNALSIRIIFLIILIICFNIFSYLFVIKNNEIILTNILFFNIVFSTRFQNIRELLEIPFKVDFKMNYVMFANIIDSITLLIFTSFLFFSNVNLLFIVLVYTLANIPGFIYIICFLKKIFNYKFSFVFKSSKFLVLESFPLFVAGFFFIIYQQIDIILLRNYVSDYSSGIFSVALRLSMPLTIIPFAIITTIFPIIVENQSKDKAKVNEIIKMVTKLLFFFSFLASIFITMKAKDIVIILFSEEYVEATVPLIFIYWSYVFIFFNNFYLNLFTILNKQKNNFIFAIVLIFTDLIVLSLTISSYGATGASLARLISVFLGYIFLKYRISKTSINVSSFNIKTLYWVLISSILFFLLKELNIFLYGIITFTLTIFLLLISNYFEKKEFLILYKLFKGSKWFPKVLLK